MSDSSAGLSPSHPPRTRWNVRHLFLLVPWVALGAAAFRPIRDNSFLWHIQAGVIQSQQGQVLRADPFSLPFFGESWRTQSWLVELGYGWMYERFDLWFVPIWLVVLGGVLFVSIGIAAFCRSHAVPATAGVLIGMSWMGLAYLAPRPVIVSFVALSLLVLVSEHRSIRWATPLLIWIWAAAHGSFIIGIGYLVLQAMRTGDRRFVGHAGTGLAVSSLTAHGYHVWGVLWAFLMNRDALEVIQEWKPPEIMHLVMWPYAAVIALIMVQLANRSIGRRDLWVIVPFLLFGLTSQRALFIAAVVLAPWVTARRSTVQETPESTIPVRMLALAAVVLVVLPFVLSPPDGRLDESKFPIAAAGVVTEGPLFHDDGIGGFLILADQGRRVLVDDRAELYGREFFDRVIAAESGRPTWRELFEFYGIRQALLRTDDGLIDALSGEGWVTVYRDEGFQVLTAP